MLEVKELPPPPPARVTREWKARIPPVWAEPLHPIGSNVLLAFIREFFK